MECVVHISQGVPDPSLNKHVLVCSYARGALWLKSTSYSTGL